VKRMTLLLFVFAFGMAVSAGAAEQKVPAPANAQPVSVASTNEKAAQTLDKETKEKKNEKTVERIVKGPVSFIRKNSMAVEFNIDKDGAEDIYLTLDKSVKVRNAKDLSGIVQGDSVKVKYLETYLEPKKKDEEPIVLSMVVTEIMLLKKARPEELSS